MIESCDAVYDVCVYGTTLNLLRSLQKCENWTWRPVNESAGMRDTVAKNETSVLGQPPAGQQTPIGQLPLWTSAAAA